MTVMVEKVILHSEEDEGVSSNNMLLTEWMALGHTSAKVFGVTRSVAQVLAIAASAGFDLRTGKARAGMEFGGAIPTELHGIGTMLYWDAA